MAVTASSLLGVNPAKATGSVMYEILSSNSVSHEPENLTFISSFPNPFSSTTSIQYFLNKPGFVNLDIYSITGEKIRVLVNESQNYGLQTIDWNVTNSQGQRVPAGIYFYRLQSGNQIKTGKLILMNK